MKPGVSIIFTHYYKQCWYILLLKGPALFLYFKWSVRNLKFILYEKIVLDCENVILSFKVKNWAQIVSSHYLKSIKTDFLYIEKLFAYTKFKSFNGMLYWKFQNVIQYIPVLIAIQINSQRKPCHRLTKKNVRYVAQRYYIVHLHSLPQSYLLYTIYL